ncbi:MAG: AsnC family transcriptional regulator, partial [Xanthobacteraceae bacterium]
MDDTDRRLIALLRQNARLPVATLAQLLKVSRGTVQNRIDRL